MSDPTAQEQQRKYVKRRSESGMKKRLIAALLTAGLLFSFGTTAFAEVSDEQTLDTEVADNVVTQDNTEQRDEEINLLNDETKDPTQEIATQADSEEATGWFGYYLSNENATWGTNTWENELESYIDKKNGKTKYKELNRCVKKDNPTKVTTMVPVWDGHTFLGWGDKERNRDGFPKQLAAIREADSTLKYYYKNGEAYTLDALWGSLSIEGGSKVYDGQPIDVKEASFALNNVALSDTYAKQYEDFLDCRSSIQYSTNEDDENSWTTDLGKFKFVDAGSYTLYARQQVKVTLTDLETGVEKSIIKNVTGQATYTITPRPVTLTSASAKKEYDGKPLTNGDVAAEGFVDGEGAAYTVTGTQTEVGSSENTFTYALNSDTLERNYKITTNYGTLTVTAKTTPDPVDPNPGTTPTPTPTATTAPTAAPSTDDTTPENTATPAPTATAAPTATPTPAPTAAPAAARAATTIPQTGDNFPAVTLVIVMLAAILGLGITIVIRAGKKK